MGKSFFGVFILIFACCKLLAEAPPIGREAAARYLAAVPADDQDDSGAPVRSKRKKVDDEDTGGGGGHLLMLGVGAYIGSQAYEWNGSGKKDSVGRADFELTYLIDKWKSMDVNLRADYLTYKLNDTSPSKLSLMPLITFPAADKDFPLYFGAGVGLGVFFQQASGSSNVSLDYELVAGARFQNLFKNFGFFFELAMKNQLLLLSSGQLNGTTLNAGGVFTF